VQLFGEVGSEKTPLKPTTTVAAIAAAMPTKNSRSFCWRIASAVRIDTTSLPGLTMAFITSALPEEVFVQVQPI
jgi:hypothetical protein